MSNVTRIATARATILTSELNDTELHVHDISVFHHEYRPHCENFGYTRADGYITLASEDGQIEMGFWFNAESTGSHSKHTPADAIEYAVDRNLPNRELDVTYSGPVIIGIIDEHETVQAWLQEFIGEGGLAAWWESKVNATLQARRADAPLPF